MRYCESCGGSIYDDNAMFCPNCGGRTTYVETQCDSCGIDLVVQNGEVQLCRGCKEQIRQRLVDFLEGLTQTELEYLDELVEGESLFNFIDG